MLESTEDELYELNDFYSDDKKHHVTWSLSKELGYPAWVCETHDRLYYQYCCIGYSDDESPLTEG